MATDNSKFRYIDASRKSLKVCLAIPVPTKRSILLSASPGMDTNVGRVSVLDAMGYSSTCVNLALQPSSRKDSILCSTVPALASLAMLDAAAKFLL